MATVETAVQPPASAVHERLVEPVFSSTDGRRARTVRIAGRLAAVLAAIWLLALLVGALGLGSLPLIPGSGVLAPAPKASASAKSALAPSAAGDSRRTSVAARTTMPAADSGTLRQRGSTSAARRRTPAHRTIPVAPQPAPPIQVVQPPVAPPPASPGRPRGRAVRQHGDQTQPAPPPPGNAIAKGQEVVNPGRLKHELLLPPPPPPPPPPPKKP
jgi:hypothetical protein